MRNTISPMFRDYFPNLNDKEIQRVGRALRRELMARYFERGESLHSQRCAAIRQTLDDLETTVAYRKFTGEGR